MNISDASYKALKAFERSPGSVKQRGEAKSLGPAERDVWTRQVRNELASAQQECGPAQHRLAQGPTTQISQASTYLHYSSTTSRSAETWTHPTKNAFVKVKSEATSSDSEGRSLSGATVYDSCGYRKSQDTSYGVETAGYIAGMKITDTGYSSTATAFKIDKKKPEESWIQEWNIR